MRANRKTSGNTLVVVMIIMATLVAFVAVAVDYTQSVSRHSSRIRTNVSAQAVGEACLDLAFAQWRQISQNTTPAYFTPTYIYAGYTDPGPPSNSVLGNSPPPTNAFASIALPTAAMFPDIPNFTATAANNQGFTVSNYKIQAVDSQFTMTTTSPPVSAWPATMEPPYISTLYTSSKDKSWFYMASADITLPTPAGNVTTSMRRIFEKRIVRPFNYFMFFVDDLELSPSSPLTIYGQVHTNGKLYTGSSNLTLSQTQPALQACGGYYYVPRIKIKTNPSRTLGATYNDDWIVGFKTGDTFHAGSATPPNTTATTVNRGPNYRFYDWDPAQWDGGAEPTNKSGPHEFLEKQVTPVSTYPDPLAKPMWDDYQRGTLGNLPPPAPTLQRFYDQAGARIEISASDTAPTVTVESKTGGTLYTGMIGPNTNVNTDSEYYGYAALYDSWIAALGADPAAAGTAHAGRIWTKVTDAATTSNSYTVTSATANFVATDVGHSITGTGIPAGAKIATRTNATTITTTIKSTVTASNVTVTFYGSANPTFARIQDNREGGLVDIFTIDFDSFRNFHPRPVTCTTYPSVAFAQRYPSAVTTNWFAVYAHALPVAGKKRALRFKNCGSYYELMSDVTSSACNASGYTGVRYPFYQFATDNPLYIQGDFNSGKSNFRGTNPVCNSATPTSTPGVAPLTNIYWDGVSGTPVTQPTTPANIIGVNVRNPVYLIADSFTILSNAWQDSNASLALSSRVASNTTIEAAMITGNVPTSATNGYSGGAENIFHLMEDWNGKYFTFMGNIVQLYPSKGGGMPGTLPGNWVPPGTAGNVYKEPLRNWYWDPFNLMNTFDNMYAVSYRKHKWSPYP